MRITVRQAFATLGVAHGASEDEARAAYRKLALQYHPDKNPHAEATAKFQEISAAYKKVCDFHKRGGNQSGLFFDDDADDDVAYDDEHDFGFGDMDFDDLEPTFEEMLMMFEMMFGGGGMAMSSGCKSKKNKKKQAKKATASTTTTAAASSAEPSQASQASAPPAKVAVPLGSTTKVGKARRRKAPLGKRRGGGMDDPFGGFIDPEMMMFEQFMGMSMNDPELHGMEEDLMEEMMHLFANASDDDIFDLAEGRGVRRKTRGKAKGKKPVSQAASSDEEEVEEVSDWDDETVSTEQKTASGNLGNQSEDLRPRDDVGVAVGSRVQVHGKQFGIVKFIGPVHYAKGEFIGVELDEPEGKNDGTLKGVSYFQCEPRRGVMLRPQEVTLAPSSHAK